MTKYCAILGASGHGKVIAEIAELNGYEVVFFDDAWPNKKHIEHWKVEGGTSNLLNRLEQFDNVIVGIGNNSVRYEKHTQLHREGAKTIPLIHPSATVSRYALLGGGTIVMAQAVINPFVRIGQAAIVNTSSSIDHDCQLADGVHICPGAKLAGEVSVGALSWVGIGAQVKQSIVISSRAIVGAGSTVIRNVQEFQTVVGNPAKVIKEK